MRNTPYKEGISLPRPVAAGQVIREGHAAFRNAAGYAIPFTAGQMTKFIGRCEETVNNSTGADGDVIGVFSKGGRVYLWANDATDPCDISTTTAYFVNGTTVCDTSNSNANPVAGEVVEVTAAGVWVKTLD